MVSLANCLWASKDLSFVLSLVAAREDRAHSGLCGFALCFIRLACEYGGTTCYHTNQGVSGIQKCSPGAFGADHILGERQLFGVSLVEILKGNLDRVCHILALATPTLSPTTAACMTQDISRLCEGFKCDPRRANATSAALRLNNRCT